MWGRRRKNKEVEKVEEEYSYQEIARKENGVWKEFAYDGEIEIQLHYAKGQRKDPADAEPVLTRAFRLLRGMDDEKHRK